MFVVFVLSPSRFRIATRSLEAALVYATTYAARGYTGRIIDRAARSIIYRF